MQDSRFERGAAKKRAQFNVVECGSLSSSSKPDNNQCQTCNKKGKFWCAACGNVAYCNLTCQRKDWGLHFSACSLPGLLPITELDVDEIIEKMQRVELTSDSCAQEAEIHAKRQQTGTNSSFEIDELGADNSSAASIVKVNYPVAGSFVVLHHFNKPTDVRFIAVAHQQKHSELLKQMNSFGNMAEGCTDMPLLYTYVFAQHQGQWFRGQVIGKMQSGRITLLSVILCDVGRIIRRSFDRLRVIKKEILRQPCYLLAARLSLLSNDNYNQTYKEYLCQFNLKQYEIAYSDEAFKESTPHIHLLVLISKISLADQILKWEHSGGYTLPVESLKLYDIPTEDRSLNDQQDQNDSLCSDQPNVLLNGQCVNVTQKSNYNGGYDYQYLSNSAPRHNENGDANTNAEYSDDLKSNDHATYNNAPNIRTQNKRETGAIPKIRADCDNAKIQNVAKFQPNGSHDNGQQTSNNERSNAFSYSSNQNNKQSNGSHGNGQQTSNNERSNAFSYSSNQNNKASNSRINPFSKKNDDAVEALNRACVHETEAQKGRGHKINYGRKENDDGKQTNQNRGLNGMNQKHGMFDAQKRNEHNNDDRRGQNDKAKIDGIQRRNHNSAQNSNGCANQTLNLNRRQNNDVNQKLNHCQDQDNEDFRQTNTSYAERSENSNQKLNSGYAKVERCIGNKEPTRYNSVQPVLVPPFQMKAFDAKDTNFEVSVLDNSSVQFNTIGCIKTNLLSNIMEVQKLLNNWKDTKQPYTPVVNEYCLALYEDEWYRAKCVEVAENGFMVVYIDFTNEGVVTQEQIRRYPTELTIPCHSFMCQINGLPTELKGAQLKYFEEKFCFQETFKIDFIVRSLPDIMQAECKSVTQDMRKKGLLN